MIGAPAPQGSDDITKLSSRFPVPTNAVALAALDAISPQWLTVDAAVASRAGVPTDVLDAFLFPNGVLFRMRALAAGWVRPGDKLRAATDVRWWTSAFKFSLWSVLGTYWDALAAAGLTPTVNLDESLALGDSESISRALVAMRDEVAFLEGKDPDCQPGDFCKPPCPPWLIPPEKAPRGTLPIPNPDCARVDLERRKRELEERRRKRLDEKKQGGIDVLMVLGVLTLAYFAARKAFR